MSHDQRSRERVTLITSDGVELDALWVSSTSIVVAVVLCHPHPEHGGSMHNPLLLTVEDAVCRSGGGVLRFDFRGVGRSGRTHTGTDGEVADVDAAARWVRGRQPGCPLAVGGWSFGGGVSHAWAARQGATSRLSWFGIAPVLAFGSTRRDATEPATQQAQEDGTGSRRLGIPAFAVVGDRDPFVSPLGLEKELGPGAEVTVLEGCDHFFVGACARRMADLLARHIAGTPQQD